MLRHLAGATSCTLCRQGTYNTVSGAFPGATFASHGFDTAFPVLISLKCVMVLLSLSFISERAGATGSYACISCTAGTYSAVLGSLHANLCYVAADALIVLLSV